MCAGAPRLHGIQSPRQELDVILYERERRACRNLDLLIDDVNSGDHFGDRMLDLYPCIHLNEEELPSSYRNSTVPAPT